MTAFFIPKNKSAEIVEITAPPAVANRLNTLGIKRGATVTLLGYSLFKGGVLLQCGAVRVGVRRRVAEQIEVKLCS